MEYFIAYVESIPGCHPETSIFKNMVVEMDDLICDIDGVKLLETKILSRAGNNGQRKVTVINFQLLPLPVVSDKD